MHIRQQFRYLFCSICLIALTILSVLSLPTTQAQVNQDLESLFSDLLEGSLSEVDESFGFSSNDTITFSDKTDTTIKVTFPTISKDGTPIKVYEFWALDTSMEDFMNNLDYDNSSMVNKKFTFSDTEVSETTLTAELTGLTTDMTYYLTITPRTEDDIQGKDSNEVSFSLGNGGEETGTGTDENNNTDDNHAAGNNQDALGNVSYTHDGKTVTMTWDDLQEADEVKVSYATISNSNNKTVAGTVDISDEIYSFSVPDFDTYTVAFLPLKDGVAMNNAEVVQTIHVLGEQEEEDEPDPDNPIPTTPPGGPEDILFFVLGASIAVYIGYKRIRLV